jgi:centrin-1
MTSRISNRDNRDNIAKIFNLYDDEKTGSISVKNLRRVAQDLGENISEDELNEMIDRASSSGDGLISVDDFYQVIIKDLSQ